ncbi:c2H2-type domain-containing protein [Trichonephila clavipes]|uniref:C2H2-type domain-containing protein n=1 Tax=Trichonephila clavipes TaxID=2585209 RepID=A0A8X6T131_TRICX|nr:c2H2-type domain-containing protein [Trichonephila clavipes]
MLNNELLQETNLARLYDDMSEKIVKESEDFEGRDSGWTLDEILRLEVRTNRYSPFRGSSSFIEVPKKIAETKAIINVINKKDSRCFMWSILAALYPNTSNPNKTSSYVPHLNKLNFDGISFPTPLNEVKKFSKMSDTGINIYSFEEDLKIFPLLISDIVHESDVGYILEVDLEYPSDLHDKHSDFPLAPENKPPPNCVGENNSTRPLNSKIKTIAGEKQISSSGEKQLNSAAGTKQLNRRKETQLGSRNETTQLCATVDRLYSRIGFSYLLTPNNGDASINHHPPTAKSDTSEHKCRIVSCDTSPPDQYTPVIRIIRKR